MKTFEQLDLIKPIRRALNDAGYQTPTPIQSRTIPLALEGRDVLGCAQTGTGKTAAFGLPILNLLAAQKTKAVPHRPSALVLAPARELAIQIGESFSTYGKYLRLRTAIVYGGVNQAKQVRQMQRGAEILIATPGRLLDLMQQRHISLDQLSIFVADEADRMLDMGFLPDLKRIIRRLPDQRQSLFFSATLPPNIIQLSRELLRDPVHVNVTPKTKSVDRIEQQVMFVNRKSKQAALRAIATGTDVDRLLTFTRTKRTADRVMQRLVKSGVKAAAIHGNKSQNARVRALESFRRKQVHVLVATDVAARGIDVDGVTHVVNFDMPEEPESYLHRIGRTGRAGSSGTAISFCSQEEKKYLRSIEKLIGQRVPVMVCDAPADEPANEDGLSVSTGNSTRSRQRRPNHERNESRARHARSDGRSGHSGRPGQKRRRRRRAKQPS